MPYKRFGEKVPFLDKIEPKKEPCPIVEKIKNRILERISSIKKKNTYCK